MRGDHLIALAVAGALIAHPAAAQRVAYNGALAYSEGSYVFAERTRSLWLSSSLSVTEGGFGLGASLPVIAQNGGVVSFVAGQPLPTGGEGNRAVGTRGHGRSVGSRGPSSGMPSEDSTIVFRDRYEVEVGDPVLWTSVEMHRGDGRLRSATVRASAKAPLRTLESGVGTGEWDFGAGGSLVMGLGRTLVLLDGGYWWFGDLPDLQLKGSILYSVGVSRSVLAGRGSVLLSLNGATSVMATVDPPLSTGATFLYSLQEGRTVTLGASVGLSEASPDVSVYLGWGLGLR